MRVSAPFAVCLLLNGAVALAQTTPSAPNPSASNASSPSTSTPANSSAPSESPTSPSMSNSTERHPPPAASPDNTRDVQSNKQHCKSGQDSTNVACK
jgi:hypothetical protein